MDDFSKEEKENKIIFKDKLNSTELGVVSNKDNNSYENIFIDEKFSLKFIYYIVRELRKFKDLFSIYSLYDSELLESNLHKMGLKVLNYNYNLFNKKYYKIDKYDVKEQFDKESEKFYLDIVNEINGLNNKYLNNEYFKKYREIDNKDYLYRIYCQNDLVLGIVKYELEHKSKSNNKCFNYNNKVYINKIVGKDKKIIKDMIIDLFNIYQKDIIISVTYSEKILLDTVKELNNKFLCCQYSLK